MLSNPFRKLAGASLRHLPFALILASFPLWGTSCSSDSRSRQEHREEEQLAAEYGRQAAMRLSPDSLLIPSRQRHAEPIFDTIAIEKTLIDVRVRETTLRKRGEEKLADIYIETFLTTLDSVNPDLRAELH